MKNYILILLILIFNSEIYSQVESSQSADNLPQNSTFDNVFDLVLNYLGDDDSSDALDVTDLRSRLFQIYNNPYNWNGISRQQLQELYFVDDATIQELLYYSEQLGTVHSIAELQLVENIDKALLYLLPSFLYVSDNDDAFQWIDAFQRSKHRVVLRLDNTPELRNGFIPDADGGGSPYLGYNFKALTKYQFSAGDNLRCGVALESDYGEPYFGKYAQGFDLYRAYIEVNNLGVVERAVAGAFRAGYGAGLVMGMPIYGSSLSQLLSSRSQSGVRGYGGSAEYPTLQGVATNLSFNHLSLSVLYGYVALDADTSGGCWSSFSSDGYHRTVNELQKRNSLSMHTTALNVAYNVNNFNLSLTSYAGFFSLPAVVASSPWSIYDFKGKNQLASSLSYSYSSRHIRFSGESALSYSPYVDSSCAKQTTPIGFATTNTLHFHLLSDTEFSLNYRYFSNNYHSFWANTSQSLSTVNGEQGISLAFRFPISASLSFQSYADIYQALWGSVYTPNDKVSYELRSEFNLNFSRTSSLLFYVRHRESPLWTENLLLAPTKLFAKERITSICLRFSNKVGLINLVSNIQANCASEYSFSDFSSPDNLLVGGWSSSSFGWLMAQDVNYSASSLPLSLRSRVAFYGAPNYSNRFYLNESDVPESGYSSSLYGSALRWYLLAKYKITPYISLAFRISQTLYSDRLSIGSSYDQINSWHRTDFHFLGSISL